MSSKNVHETLELHLNFSKYSDGLIPTVVQDHASRDILMLGFSNQAAYEKTIALGKATFWSRGQNKLWTKGETSGDYLHVREIRVDCDQDTLLYLVDMIGENVCHTNRPTCFYRKVDGDKLEYIL